MRCIASSSQPASEPFALRTPLYDHLQNARIRTLSGRDLRRNSTRFERLLERIARILRTLRRCKLAPISSEKGHTPLDIRCRETALRKRTINTSSRLSRGFVFRRRPASRFPQTDTPPDRL